MRTFQINLSDLIQPGVAYRGAETGGDGQALFLRLEGDAPGALALPGGGHAVGFLNVCTHMGCRLARRPETALDYAPGGRAVTPPCPCHGTTFDLALGGLVVLGPASADLPSLALRVEAGALIGASDDADDPERERWGAP